LYLFKFIIEHLKRVHVTKLNLVTNNEDDPVNQSIQTPENTSSPSTFAISSILSSQHLTSTKFSEPPSKLFGSTKVNEFSDSEIKAINKCLIKMIVADYQPLSLVENVGFIEFKIAITLFYP